jgi:hypothetical protein
MSRQKAWSDYSRALRRILDSVKDPGTEIEVHGITQVGGVPGYESSTAFGVLAPAKTPTVIVGQLNQDIVKILNAPDSRERMSAQGLEAVGGTPQQYSQHLKDDLAKYGRIVKAAGIKLD